MPYPNEHAARQNDPRKYRAFRRMHKGFPPGIDVIFGIRGAGGRAKTEIQALRFRALLWTPAEARRWLRTHGFKARIEVAQKRPAVSLSKVRKVLRKALVRRRIGRRTKRR